jgi:phosphoglycolate phosphatase-like HAD superfamily hydrolase
MNFTDIRFEGVVFHTDAVFYGAKGEKPTLMPRITEAFNYLQSGGYRLILATSDLNSTSQIVEQLSLSPVFTHEGTLQICPITHSEKQNPQYDTPIYWDGLKELGIDTQRKLMAITSRTEGIRSARSTGISNVIGYYGRPDVKFGEMQAYKGSLLRNIRAQSGATQVIGNYAELPETMFYMRPTQLPIYETIGTPK